MSRKPQLGAVLVVLLAVGAVLLGTRSPARVPDLPPPAAGPAVIVAPRHTAPDDPLSVAGNWLVRDGRRTDVVGVNAYQAATWYGTNWGCGPPVYDLPQLFAQVPEGGLVRVWAFQAQGWNNKVSPGRIDFTGIDRVVAAAALAHRQLILTLSDQAGACDDGHWHDQAWYDGGYAAPRANDDGRGLGNLSYLDWVRTVVSRYAANPAVAVWEPVNEPQAPDCAGAAGSACYDAARLTCPAGAAASIASFFTAIGGVIRSLAPHTLISEGVSGGGQCGLAGNDYATVGASSGVDLLTYHDYGAEAEALPGGLAGRLDQAAALVKPLLVEEVGLDGGAACTSLSGRAGLATAKASAAFAAGAVGWMPWWFDESGPGGCGQDYGPGDPALAAIAVSAADATPPRQLRGAN